jgi:glutamyl-Q tRNA(Asp) synthetase
VTKPSGYVGRFAPSTTGHAHPGTILAALLAWLDARSQNGKFILRLEDLDPERAQENYAASMLEDLTWFGLDWDELNIQSENQSNHEQALDTLAQASHLYPCNMSRAQIKKYGIASPDGGFAYPNTNQNKALPEGGWRKSQDPLRAKLPVEIFTPQELSEKDLSQNPSLALGDPVVRRRDGATAYNLAVVVDDDRAGVTHVVRGEDIASSTATQIALMSVLKITQPIYRHHFLLLEPRGDKLAKLHGSIGAPLLREHYSAAELCGILAHIAGLTDSLTPCSPQSLIRHFDWEKIRKDNIVLEWDETNCRLTWE